MHLNRQTSYFEKSFVFELFFENFSCGHRDFHQLLLSWFGKGSHDILLEEEIQLLFDVGLQMSLRFAHLTGSKVDSRQERARQCEVWIRLCGCAQKPGRLVEAFRSVQELTLGGDEYTGSPAIGDSLSIVILFCGP